MATIHQTKYKVYILLQTKANINYMNHKANIIFVSFLMVFKKPLLQTSKF